MVRLWTEQPYGVSIHFMLLFICKNVIPAESMKTVSIHLMLLFIMSHRNFSKQATHVSIIHFMLLFIAETRSARRKRAKFQYISCCYLSEQKADIDIEQLCFNISHVVIYLDSAIFPIFFCFVFQYISCCYLS